MPAGRRSGAAVRLALGVSYLGTAYHGWQSQPDVPTVQDAVEARTAAVLPAAPLPLRTICAGRTDTGVHALNQVIHLDTEIDRREFSWIRGSNRYLPPDIAVQWCRRVPDDFHARYSARGRRYVYLLLESAVRPAIEAGRVGWVFRPLDGDAMRAAAALLIGEHDFSAFRSAECQALSPIKQLREIAISRHGQLLALRFRGERVSASHGSQPDGLPDRGRRPAAGRRRGLPRCWPAATAARRRRPLPPTACISSARITMPISHCRLTPQRWTGCPVPAPADAAIPTAMTAAVPESRSAG